jgi:hypothetical protein
MAETKGPKRLIMQDIIQDRLYLNLYEVSNGYIKRSTLIQIDSKVSRSLILASQT